MDPARFDALTRSLGGARSRRGVLQTLGAVVMSAVGLAGLARNAAAKPGGPGGNSDCAAFCHAVFGDTRAAGQCTSDAAHGTGLCYRCGPQGDGTQKLCGQTCVSADSCCPDQVALNGGCFTTCDPLAVHCPSCPSCGCVNTRDSTLCLNTGTDTGSCNSDTDCPTGSVCAFFGSGNPSRPWVCKQPCCT